MTVLSLVYVVVEEGYDVLNEPLVSELQVVTRHWQELQFILGVESL